MKKDSKEMYRSADLTKWEDPAQDYRHSLCSAPRRSQGRVLVRALDLLKGNFTRNRQKP